MPATETPCLICVIVDKIKCSMRSSRPSANKRMQRKVDLLPLHAVINMIVTVSLFSTLTTI